MSINLKIPDIQELKPRITVFGVGGAGGNAVNNMIQTGLVGCDFVVANTDAQALAASRSERVIQMGVAVTEGLGAGSQPEVGRAAAEEVIDEINDHLAGSHMVFITAGMGGGTGTGAAPVIAQAAREQGILTVGVVTKPFQFEGARRMRVADAGIDDLQSSVDTLIIIPNQNLFRLANAQTTFADAFAMADQVLHSGVSSITDLMVKEGLINLDFADVRSIMRSMGKAMMGTGEATGEKRAMHAAEAAIANPLLDETSMQGARGLLISITGGNDLTLFEVDEAATRIREEVDPDANIILGATFDSSLDGVIRVSVVATGIDKDMREDVTPAELRMVELTQRLKTATVKTQPVRDNVATLQVAANRAVEAVAADLDVDMEETPVPAAVDPAVEIRPYRPAHRPSEPTADPETLETFDALQASAEKPEPDRAYIPPAAEAPVRSTPMPRVEDFPQVTQREARAAATVNADSEEDHRPMGLLRRLASNLARHGEADHDERHAQPARRIAKDSSGDAVTPSVSNPSAQDARSAAPAAAEALPIPSLRPTAPPSQVAAAAPRQPTPGLNTRVHLRPRAEARELDFNDRGEPKRSAEEDQLEIPAFLRRQAQ